MLRLIFADQVRQRIRVVVLAVAVLTAEDNHLTQFGPSVM